MKIYRLTFIISLVVVLFISGCRKPDVTPIAKRVRKKTADLEGSEAQEARAFLAELRKKNPFSQDHLSGTAAALSGGSDLKGITWDASRPFAIIGTKVVVEGDILDGKKVIKINKDSVVLEEAGRQIILELE